jgi:hypothetical protein
MHHFNQWEILVALDGWSMVAQEQQDGNFLRSDRAAGCQYECDVPQQGFSVLL